MKSQPRYNRLRASSIVLIVFLMTAVLASSVYAALVTTTVDSAGDVGSYTSLALNSSGFPVISYYDQTNGDLKVAVCGNVTCSTGNTLTTVDSVWDVGTFTSLVLNSSGFPVISYYDETNFDLKVAACGNATCSAGNTLTTVDSAGEVGSYTSLVLNSSGFPVISYWDYTNLDLKVAVCGNATCSAGNTLTTVDSAGEVGGYSSLTLNSSGFPVISYLDNTNGNLKVAVCGNATCSAGNTLTTVDNSVGLVGQFTSLALNINGFPVISYKDATNGDLKLAVCGNATCSAGNTLITVDNSIADVGDSTSLALNGSGIPIISYHDDTNDDLKVAICGNATCSSGNTLTAVDSVGGVGLQTSLALNSSGFPVISYYDDTNGDLKVALFDTIAPTVLSHTLQASYTGTGPNIFTVTFSEDVNNPAGNTVTDDVTNPANYRIINKGTNGIVDTASCAVPLAGDDSQVLPSSVIYIPNTAVVTLTSPLSAGNYRLFVCGTTSIVDLALNPLGGGVDYTFDFTVAGTSAGASGKDKFRPRSLPHTGFAPNVVSVLPSQPVELAYTQMSDLWLEIPSQNIKFNIVGVPQVDNTWDVKWLGQDAGWLNGTAFPTWEGNSVVTAHVTDSNGLPGPFANLKDLKYGNQVIVHLLDQQYIFEVRSTRLVRPQTTNYAFEHLKDNSYLTLITCQNYNEKDNSYLFRRVVRAVLINVK
jgi:LPXTG-site transpeptidase (sortase) family protein